MTAPPPDPRTDEQLVAAANLGDAGAFETLYFRYRDWAASLALRFTGDREAAQDVVQEAFAYLFGKFPGFRLRARLTTVLYPAVRNTALAMRRKKRPEAVGEELAWVPLVGASPAGAPGDSSTLSAAIARLPPGQAEALLMRAVDDMSTTEIAIALGIPEGTVKSRIHHATAALRADPALRGHFHD